MTYRIDKPWGYETIWAQTDRYVGKILHINAGQSLSLQYHRRKDETIYLLSGQLRVVLDTVAIEPAVGESVRIAPNVRHRFIAVTDCEVVEVSTPELDDVVRLEDQYGRADAKHTPHWPIDNDTPGCGWSG